MPPALVSLDEVVMYLRELLAMSKDQLLREANFAHRIHRQTKMNMITFALERKFNPDARDPTVAITLARRGSYRR